VFFFKKFVLCFRYALSATEDLLEKFKETNDEFGDSYTELCTVESLKEVCVIYQVLACPIIELAQLFSSATFNSTKRPFTEIKDTLTIGTILKRRKQLDCIAEIEARYLGEELVPSPERLFRRVCVYLDHHPIVRVSEEMVCGRNDLPNDFLPDGVIVVGQDDNGEDGGGSEGMRKDIVVGDGLSLAGLLIQTRGGQVADVFGPWTTHVLIPDEGEGLCHGRASSSMTHRSQRSTIGTRASGGGGSEARREFFLKLLLLYPLRHKKRPHVVSKDWVQSCINGGSI
jgi:hypothetical protein